MLELGTVVVAPHSSSHAFPLSPPPMHHPPPHHHPRSGCVDVEYVDCAAAAGVFRRPQVRTTQEVDGQEAIAVVFSSGAASWEAKAVDSEDALGRERLVKCKVYVEAMEQEPQLHLAKDARAGCNFYIVLETEKKNRIVTEALGAGNLSWVQNPNNLEDRNSLAKLLFTVDCKDDLHARDLKQFQRTLILPPSALAFPL